MNTLAVHLIINLMEYWILILLMQYICSAHIRLNRRTILLSSLISLSLTALGFLFFSDISSLICMPCAIALTVLLFGRHKLSGLIRFFPALGIFFALTITPEIFLDELAPASHIEIHFWGYSTTLLSLLTDAVIFILLLILQYLLNKYHITLIFRTREIIAGIMLFFFAFLAIGMIMWINRSHFSTARYIVYTAIFVLSFLFIVGYFFYNLYESHILISRQMTAENEMEYLQLQMEALQNRDENDEQARKLRHDLANHLAVMKSLCEDGNYDEVKTYAEQLGGSYAFSGGNVITGNHIADLIVSSKMKTAKEHGITFTFEGLFEHLSTMTAPDLCGLLCNAYDNAIEACLSQENAAIDTKVSTTRNYTVIRIQNSVQKKVVIRNNRITTSKPDKKSHGYGITIMNQIAAKYHGSCAMSCSDTVFELRITLRLP